MQINYKSKEEIEFIRISSLLVGASLAEVAKIIRPGITTLELDKVAEDFIRSNDAKPAFKGYKGFPGSLCISVNAEVVHGIPGKRILRDGDIISVDCGVIKNGWFGDSAYTFAVGEVKEEDSKLLTITKYCLMEGLKFARQGNRLGDISSAIQTLAEQNGYGVVRELVGHGIGRSLHEKPEVPNYGKRGQGVVLKKGLVIAVEPMINQGKKGVKFHDDNWTVTTVDLKPSAHFEHTIAITDGDPDILSSFELIEKAIEENENLYNLING